MELQDNLPIRLLSVPLEDAPAYEALSYAWGDATHTARIRCGQGTLDIRPNVEDTLRALIFASETRILWIDGLFINQSNDEEKSKQVQMMGLIYWHAERVIIWLGMDDDCTTPAGNVFQLIESTYNQE
ncbi:hypothetical protein BS50DRAFT_489488 [Corynespora cassiicola Philippines]|uniref:Heterokaryon incompatibility domain-containing protein n=1 Tax=Corynespora cassiicola Philippines TaxID=1448308 RepID=A0A2T2NVN6_CORCC|nr:hypothetical protein BS50DRAFT_489488 [Corynespora cassiicola Philippines]